MDGVRYNDLQARDASRTEGEKQKAEAVRERMRKLRSDRNIAAAAKAKALRDA